MKLLMVVYTEDGTATEMAEKMCELLRAKVGSEEAIEVLKKAADFCEELAAEFDGQSWEMKMELFEQEL